MTLDIPIAAAGRTEAARALIDQAQDDPVELATVSALDLCVLGGPAHPLFDEPVARAWLRLGNRQRNKVIDSVTESMVHRGLLAGTSPQTGFRHSGGPYSLQPELGLMLAARCRPAFIIVTETEDQTLRTPRFFALGDQAEPVRAVVAELPAAPPSDHGGSSSHASKLGPLGWIYRHVLLSRGTAAEMLAKWTISLPRRSDGPVPSGYLVSAYHPDQENPVGYRLRVRGDGTRARVDSDGDQAAAEYDVEGLREVMLELITRPSR